MDKPEVRKLYRSSSDRMLGGVCGGLAEYFNIDSTLMRILWVVFTLVGGAGLLLYIVSLIIIPLNPGEAASEVKKSKTGSSGLIWGIVLIALGLIVLAGNFNWVFFPFFWGGFALFWPLLIIVAGLALIFAGRRGLESKKCVGTDQLYRMRSDRMFLGIASGTARHFNLDPTVARLLWSLFIVFTGGIGLVVYIILYFVLPDEPESTKEEAEDVQE